MKYFHHFFFSILLLIFFSNDILSQSLVPNSSFSDSTCSVACANPDQFCLPLWFSPTTATPDYYDGCWENLINDWCGVPPPINNIYNETAGIIVYDANSLYREYVSIRLDSALIEGKNYCVEFHVKLCKSSLYAIDKIGIYIGDSLFQNNSLNLPFLPQVESDDLIFLDDTLIWHKIEGQYISLGGEEFITLGNFRDDILTNTSIIPTGNENQSYYLIDNISVWNCEPDTTPILLPEISIPNIFSPNGDNQNEQWMIEISNIKKLEGKIFNRWGKMVHTFNYSGNTNTNYRLNAWEGKNINNGKPVSEGVYYYILETIGDNDQSEIFKGTVTLVR